MSTHPSVSGDEWEDDGVPTLFASVARYRTVIAPLVLVVGVLAYVASSSRPAMWQATSTLFVSTSNVFTGEAVDVRTRVQQEAGRMSSYSVYQAASQQLDETTTPRDLQEQVAVQGDASTGSIEVSATSADPARAADIANAVNQAYLDVVRAAVQAQIAAVDDLLTQRANELADEAALLADEVEAGGPDAVVAERRLQTVQVQLTEIRSRIGELAVDAALRGTGVAHVEPAVPPDTPASPKPVRDAAAAVLLTLAGASAVAYWRAGSTTPRTPDPGEVLGAPMLARIPDLTRQQQGVAAPGARDGSAVEAYQFLLAGFEYVVAERAITSVVVTGVNPGDGSSVTALRLAMGLSDQGRRMVLVDADIRSDRGLTSLLEATGGQGLTSLAEGHSLDEVVHDVTRSPSADLRFVPSGPSPRPPVGQFATRPYRDALAKIIADHDLTLVDGGPLLTTADASAVATQVEGILLVVDADVSEEDLRRARDRLRLLPTPLIGCVVNRVPGGRGDVGHVGPRAADRIRQVAGWIRRRRADGTDGGSEDDGAVEPAVASPA